MGDATFQSQPARAVDLSAKMLAITGLAGATITILTALGYEHLGGYAPCPLCLQQRYAYYAAIPLGLLAVWCLSSSAAPTRRQLAAGVLALITLAFAINAGLGVYHAGAEWEFWQGPTACAGGATDVISDASGLLAALEADTVVRCDKPSWRFLGISFAGYNALISAALAGIAALGAITARRA
ncbi:MAG: disulfide bond formation protein B [Pseudomonadota bacterium]